MYSIDLFQAERHTCGSTYTLTLSGFAHTITQCTTTCGDGIVAGNEVCDDGTNNGSYGGCLPGCVGSAPRCGDSIVQARNGEQCDDGVENGATGDKCSATCKLQLRRRRRRGGRAVRPRHGQQHRRLRRVQPDCTLRAVLRRRHQERQRAVRRRQERRQLRHLHLELHPRRLLRRRHGAEPARDVRPGRSEQRDGLRHEPVHQPLHARALLRRQGRRGPVRRDLRRRRQQRAARLVHRGLQGVRSAADVRRRQDRVAASSATTASDNGTASSKCDVHCRLKCGNGYKDPGEQCDNGVNNGSYGTCNSNCTLAGYCGDGIKNGPEICDNGANNVSPATAYGTGVCTTACTFAPVLRRRPRRVAVRRAVRRHGPVQRAVPDLDPALTERTRETS